jgi:UDP-N-acetylmuramoyl-tripeptide--D-alanyl-D-alanine ligase
VIVLVIAIALAALNGVRWLRVAQREHYEPGRVTVFGFRWLFIGVGLPLRGRRPGPLRWTRRLRTLAVVFGVLDLLLIVLFPYLWLVWIAGQPVVLDVALLLTAPLENALANRWVAKAKRKFDSIRPTVVAITGSYGKTSTKAYVAHLVAGARSVVATPGSFNNKAGLARAINENLAIGTEVFVAEMGTYGPGEIRAMCEWVTPRIAALTAIGPVHLERFKSLERTASSKAEIFERAEVAVLNGDDERVAAVASGLTARVVMAHASDAMVDVAPSSAAPTNVAVAIAIARELGVGDDVIRQRLPSLPVPDHRLAVSTSPKGFTIIDDTFNANPAGVRRALDTLREHATADHRRVVVTPGMYELGPVQDEENEAFARAAGEVATDIVIVGRTNRRALIAGAPKAIAVPNRERAVKWVRDTLGPGDTVVYVNDQPDHYP